jgi:lipopolysaccharide/colanic/teichoic acid biosynthesis glycosyltransferase
LHSHLSPYLLVTPSRARRSRVARRARAALLRARAAVLRLGPVVRRSLDIMLAGVALLALVPLFALTALAIRLTSRGPIFFAQTRVGQYGRRFSMFKFRSMYAGADALKTALAAQVKGATDGVRFKLRRDPRVTPVGRLIRKLSIDELPQLWNVVRGDMTLVGPRPPVPREVVLYDPRALRRLEVRPGLTCLWQIGGRSDLNFDQQVSLDIEYIDRVRPIQEIAIVARTIPAVITGRGAY